jgi:hypothetical protein
MCDDCQTFGQWLGPERILDANGGSEVYQTTPAQLQLTEGLEHLCCLRLSPKGLMRWYAGCCRTPVANCLNRPKLPFAGLHMRFVDPSVDAAPRDEAFGPIIARVQARWGKPPLPDDAYPRAPLSVILRSLRQLVGGYLHGRHSPSPFFDPESGAPVVEPTVLSLEDRKRYRALVGPS